MRQFLSLNFLMQKLGQKFMLAKKSFFMAVQSILSPIRPTKN